MADEAPPRTQTTSDAPGTVGPGAWIAEGLRVVSHLHRGRHGDVYGVVDETDGARRVAKVVRPDREGDAHSAANLRAEGRRLAWLDHPCIPRGVRLIAEPPGHLLEWIPGPALRAHMHAEGRLPWREVARLGADVAAALAYVHDAGLIHADVKPQNILVAPDRFVLIDFELARSAHVRAPGVGTRLFRSPEAARGDVLGPATDAWGLGVVLYRAATGHLPFKGEGDPQVHGRPSRVSAWREGGGALPAIIDALLAPAPLARPLMAWLALELRVVASEAEET